MQKPTQEEIDIEIDQLKTLKLRVPQFNYFREDNWVMIDAEITVLEKNLSEDAIYEMWTEEVTLASASYARRWLDGDGEDGSPSDGWANLVIE